MRVHGVHVYGMRVYGMRVYGMRVYGWDGRIRFLYDTMFSPEFQPGRRNTARFLQKTAPAREGF